MHCSFQLHSKCPQNSEATNITMSLGKSSNCALKKNPAYISLPKETTYNYLCKASWTFPPKYHSKRRAGMDYLVLRGWQTSWWVSTLPGSPAGQWQFPSSFFVEGCYFLVPAEMEKEFCNYTCSKRNTVLKERLSTGVITVWKLIRISFLLSSFFNYSKVHGL